MFALYETNSGGRHKHVADRESLEEVHEVLQVFLKAKVGDTYLVYELPKPKFAFKVVLMEDPEALEKEPLVKEL